MSDEDQTILLRLRNQAKVESDVSRREYCQDTADQLQEMIELLWRRPTDEVMITLNGLWVRADRLLGGSGIKGGGSSGGAMAEGARLAA